MRGKTNIMPAVKGTIQRTPTSAQCKVSLVAKGVAHAAVSCDGSKLNKGSERTNEPNDTAAAEEASGPFVKPRG